MKTYDRILVPLDGSQLAEFILPHVWNLAGCYNATVTLLHVIEAQDVDPEQLTPSRKAARSDIADYLERTTRVVVKKGPETEWYVSYGDPAEEIVRQAGEGEYDLVAMSTRGQSGRVGEGMGSVAMSVISTGSVPVLVVRPPDEVARR